MTDIRKGDLVKATNRVDREMVVTGRVTRVSPEYVTFSPGAMYQIKRGDLEVLDRPLPPIPKELLFGAIDAYRKADGMKMPTADHHLEPDCYGDTMTAVINFVRDYDRKNDNKESK